ncbi:DUF3152 domain-containing protein [Brachybacterium vulturis]|uniref:DUF3152 domain-containing protein n=1 Tax=Brachybacterium vulturis TaxID=2017484 RepID=UPI0012FDB8BF|nr:DUF3152 domain-containing protein [Brachybacterium vulturis]
MSHPTAPRPQLRLTRRGRLLRSGLVLLLAVLLILALTLVLRTLGGEGEPVSAAASSTPSAMASDGGGEGQDGSPAARPSPTPVAEAGAAEEAAESAEIVRSGTVGDGTWTVAAAAAAPAESAAGSTVRTYALRVEGGTGIGADEAAARIAEVLADPRGWQDLEDVTFQQVATLEDAELTISLASPPTVDELCLPARTGGLWSCRVGPDVVLNSDRWLHATPTYDDLSEYRAYMINHEVGHFLGHSHARCGGAGEASPVMLQQSIDLQGCVPNAWPADAPSR